MYCLLYFAYCMLLVVYCVLIAHWILCIFVCRDVLCDLQPPGSHYWGRERCGVGKEVGPHARVGPPIGTHIFAEKTKSTKSVDIANLNLLSALKNRSHSNPI